MTYCQYWREVAKKGPTGEQKDDAADWGTCAVGEALDLGQIPYHGDEAMEQAILKTTPGLYSAGRRFYEAIDDERPDAMLQACDDIDWQIDQEGGPDAIRERLATAAERIGKADAAWRRKLAATAIAEKEAGAQAS